MSEELQALKARLADIHNLGMAGAVLDWDQQTYMPPGGVAARAEQKATLSKLGHELFTDDRTQTLLARAEAACQGLPEDDDDAALLRMARRDLDKATRIPAALVEEKSRVTSLAQEEWAKARAANDYAAFAPWLERIVELERRTAEALGYKERLYDALVDLYEPGMTSRKLDEVFEELKRETVPLVKTISANQSAVDDSVLHREYDETAQKQFAEAVLADCGFDFTRGRQDRSVHPFCTHFSRNDVRLTTRYDRNFLSMALFGSLHEMGHGLYEQGPAPSLEGTLLSSGASLGLHESQSRLWENLVGRSRGFWKHYYPKLQETFPAQLQDISSESFYRAINRSGPSLIRVEADEVTYNLHIIIRYEMENELLEGRLSVADAPEAWNARMESYLGLTPPDNRHGILQDVHWSIGIMGYFPTYSLGNILSVQLFEKAIQEVPSIPDDIEHGRFEPLLTWLRANVHQYGRKLLPDELIQRATGSTLTVTPYVRYLKSKLGELYGG
ncbi:MAG: carboxypeptidase M32 [Actinomycetota bacterium]